MRARTIPLDCWEKWEIKGFIYLFWREFWEKEQENIPRKCSKMQNFCFRHRGVLGWKCDYLASSGLKRALGLIADINNPILLLPDFNHVFEGLHRKVWMYSFQKSKGIENPTVKSNVMASRSELTRLARFSRYLNHFNFDFSPWIVIGKGIQ